MAEQDESQKGLGKKNTERREWNRIGRKRERKKERKKRTGAALPARARAYLPPRHPEANEEGRIGEKKRRRKRTHETRTLK